MKVVREVVAVYYAFDGKRFDNEDTCIRYERDKLPLVEKYWQDLLRKNGQDRRRCKKAITDVEKFIVEWRSKAVSLLSQHKAMRSYKVCNELEHVFGQLASQLNNRGLCRRELDEKRQAYRRMRASLDQIKAKTKEEE